MPTDVAESFPLLSSAYGDLADGLRKLAAELDAGVPDPTPDPDPGPERALAVELVSVAARGVGAVCLQALLLGSLLLLGFHIWMTLAPPLRPHS